MNVRSDTDCRKLVKQADECWTLTALAWARRPDMSLYQAEAAARRTTQAAVFLGSCQRQGLLEPDTWSMLASGRGDPLFRDLLTAGQGLFAPTLWQIEGPSVPASELSGAILRALAGLSEPCTSDCAALVHQRLLDLHLERDGQGAVRRCVGRGNRKATGTFYTPGWLADYMAERVLSEHLDGTTQSGDWPIIFDPACGGGSFLMAAWRRLLAVTPEANNRLDRILQSLFGIDVDAEAVLLARRSLWLAAMHSGCTQGTHAAEIVGANIRCGDLLVDSAAASCPDRFDVILGNPPYRRELGAKSLLDHLAQTPLGRRYRSPRMDLSYYFLHRGLELLRPGGRLAFVLGAYWTAGRGAGKLIESLRTESQIEEIVCLDQARVFPGVSGRHMVLMLRKWSGGAATRIKRLPSDAARTDGRDHAPRGLRELPGYVKSAAQLFHDGMIDLEPPEDELLAAIERGQPLGRLAVVRQGIVENPASVTRAAARRFGLIAGEGVFALSPDELARLDIPHPEQELLRPYHDLRDLGRYWSAEAPSLRLIYSTPQTWPRLERFPRLAAHLARFRPIMDARRETRSGRRQWWHLHWPREEWVWQAPKLVSLQMGPRPAFVPATAPLYVPFSVNVAVPRPETGEHLFYLAGLLNSRLVWQWFRHHAKRRGAGLEINGHVLQRLPIRPIDFADASDRRAHDEVVELVRQRLACRKDCSPAAPPAENQEASLLDRRLDRLVCRLYGVPEA